MTIESQTIESPPTAARTGLLVRDERNGVAWTEGTVTLGANVKVGFFSQHSLETLNERNSVFDELTQRLPYEEDDDRIASNDSRREQ